MGKMTTKEAVANHGIAAPEAGSCLVELENSPHRVEQEVQRCLKANPHLKFSSLVIRRMAGGICLQGVMETDDQCPDVCSLVQEVAGVQRVVNQLLVAPKDAPPPKG